MRSRDAAPTASTFFPDRRIVPTGKPVTSKANEIAVSSVTFLEIALEQSIGKLAMESFEPEALPGIAGEHGFVLCPLSPGTAASFHRLARLNDHRDPFDRTLVWQAIREGWTLVSRDRSMSAFGNFRPGETS